MKIKVALFCVCYIMQTSFSQEKGKHLFILSGQSNMVHLDPNESFVPTLDSVFGKENIFVVKDAMGSQPISRWYKEWKSLAGEITENQGDLYDQLIQKVLNVIRGKEIVSVSFIWMQGERDARQANGNVYENSLKGLHNQLSKDLKRSDINFIIGRLNDFDMSNEKWPHWTKIRDIQVKVANSNPRFGWVNTDDLNDGLNSDGISVKNDLHMTIEGYKKLGKRFAEKAIELIDKN